MILLKVFAHKVLKNLTKSGDNSEFTSKDMFPQLNELFDSLDERLGFDIEVKYPLDLMVNMI